MKKPFYAVLSFALAAVLSVGSFAGIGAVSASAEATPQNQNYTLGTAEITMIRDTTDLGVKLSGETNENYYPESRKWNGISTAVSYGNNLFAAWYTGGTKEPHSDNYIPVAASDDNGETWKDPFLIVDPINDTSVVLPVFFVNGAGELLLYYSVLPGSKMYGIKLMNADGPLDQITYEGPFLVSQRTVFVKPTILSDGSIVYATGDKVGYSGVYKSVDDGYSYTKIATIPSKYVKPEKTYTEASIVERADGSLWMLSRLEKGYHGGIEQAFSYDKGITWTTSEGGLEYPLQGPGSRTGFMKLRSGALLFVTNESTSNRDMMTAYLSEDDGKTWPYSILIDRYTSAYPEVYQDPDGKILIVYDKGRYLENSIRLTILREEDIKAGRFVSNTARDKLTVTKLNKEYADIVSVGGLYERYYVYPVGTKSAAIRDKLPNAFTVTDSNGKNHEVSGIWKSPGYKENEVGCYVLMFQCELPATLIDSFDYFRIRVDLIEKKAGCGSSVSAGAHLGTIGASLIALLSIRKKRIANK